VPRLFNLGRSPDQGSIGVSVYINDGARHTGELVDLGEGHVDLPWPRKTASRLAPAVRAYLAEIGARGKAEREQRVELGHFLRALADRPETPQGEQRMFRDAADAVEHPV
jgi:hypothetical protein